MDEESGNKVVLPEGDYAQYLVTKAGDIANAKIRERENKWRAFSGLAITILAVLGFANLSSIESDIESKIDFKIKQKLPSEVELYIENNRTKIVGDSLEKVTQDVASRIAFMQLYNISIELSKVDEFSTEQRDTAVGLLEKVAKNPDIVNSPEFSGPLEKIIDSFLAADQSIEIDKLESLLGERIHKSEGIVLSMVLHYGMRVTESKEIAESDVNTFSEYAKTALKSFNYPGTVMPYQLAINVKQNSNSKTKFGVGILQDVEYFEAEEVIQFLNIMDTMREGNLYTFATGQGKRAEELFSQTHELYKTEIELLREIVADIDTDSNLDSEKINKLPEMLTQ